MTTTTLNGINSIVNQLSKQVSFGHSLLLKYSIRANLANRLVDSASKKTSISRTNASLISRVGQIITWLRSRSWQYRSFEIFDRRFARGTQRLQSILEICFTFLSGCVAVGLMDAGLLTLGVFLYESSIFFQGLALLLRCLSFAFGCVLGSVAMISLLRWVYPLGTGYGLNRLHPYYLDHLNSRPVIQMSPEIKTRIRSTFMCAARQVQLTESDLALFMNTIETLGSLDGGLQAIDRWSLCNMIDSIRSFKNIIRQLIVRNQSAGLPTDSKIIALLADLREIVHAMKHGSSDSQKFLSAVEYCSLQVQKQLNVSLFRDRDCFPKVSRFAVAYAFDTLIYYERARAAMPTTCNDLKCATGSLSISQRSAMRERGLRKPIDSELQKKSRGIFFKYKHRAKLNQKGEIYLGHFFSNQQCNVLCCECNLKPDSSMMGNR